MQSNPKANKIRRIGKTAKSMSETNNINAHAKPSDSEASAGKSRAQNSKKSSPMKKMLWVSSASSGTNFFIGIYLSGRVSGTSICTNASLTLSTASKFI